MTTRPQRPLVSDRIRLIPPSGIRRFFDLLGSMEGVISLGVGEPDFVTPWTIREAAITSLEQGHTHYTSNYGLLELRQLISSHVTRLYGVEYDPEREILVTVGVSEGLDIALRAVLDPGEAVLSPDPGYVSYVPGIVMAGGVPVPVPTREEDGFALRPDALRDALARTSNARGLLLGYPANPTGAVMERDALEEVAAIARDQDLLVLSDEIYDRLVYDGHRHTCVASLPGMQERTILLGGFSKAYAMTGFRLGWACGPAEAIEAMMKVHQYTMLSAPTPSQAAGIEALRHGEAEVHAMVEEYDRRRRVMVRGLRDAGLPVVTPRGAFYAFPSIRDTGLSSETFAERLLFEEKVAVIPGNAFGACGEGHVRACYATALPQVETAMERIAAFVHRVRREGA